MYRTIERLRQKGSLDLGKLDKVPLWLLPLFMALLLFPIRGVITSPDSALYTVLGLNLYHGQGYVNNDWLPYTDRGPIFPGLIALFFWLFGVSLESAIGVVRFFFVVSVGLVYALGTRFFNRAAGLIAALLVLTALTLHELSSSILLDNAMACFILLSQLLTFMAFEQKRNIYFGLAGVTMGLAFLTKQVAGIFFPLPALLWLVIPVYRRPFRTSWQGILLFYGTLALTLLPWFIYLNNTSDTPAHELQAGLYVLLEPLLTSSGGEPTTATASNSSLPATVGRQLGEWWSWIVVYYQRDLAGQFSLAPVFLLAWGYVLWRAVSKRTRPDLFLLGGFSLFVPLMPYWAKSGLGPRLSIYFYLWSYLALARLLGSLIANSQVYLKALGLAGVIAALVVQLWAGDRALVHLFQNVSETGFVPGVGVYGPSFGLGGWEEGGEHTPLVREAAEWLAAHTAPGDPILMEKHQWNKSLYFYLDARQPVYDMPYVYSVTSEGYDRDQIKQPILFLWSYADRTDPANPNAFLYALSEPHLLSQIETLGIKYIVVTQWHSFISLYFTAHPNFEQVKSFGGGQIQIFKVHGQPPLLTSLVPAGFEMHIGQALPDFLENLRHYGAGNPAVLSEITLWQPNTQISIEQEYLQGLLGLSPAEIERIRAGRYPAFKTNRIVTVDDYVRLVYAQGPQAVAQAVTLQQRKAEFLPNNPWPYLTLGGLFLAQNDNAAAVEAYEKALAVDPGGPTRSYLDRAKIIKDVRENAPGNMMESIRLSLNLKNVGEETHLVSNTGYESVLEPANLGEGPTAGSPALRVDETTRLILPPSEIDLEQGTLSIWARLTDLNKEYATLVRLNNNQDLWLYRYTYDGGLGGHVVVYYNGSSLGFSAWPITGDEWHHYVFTWQNGQQKLYIDGTPTMAAEAPASPAATQTLALGWLGDGEGMAWEGFLTNLTSFDRPLSEIEVGAFHQLEIYK